MVAQGQTVTLQLPREITPALAGLPPSSRTFTGRDSVLQSLDEVLDNRQPGSQTVLITGLAGVGKTELALQAAHRALTRQNQYPGGVLFTDLFGYDPTRRVSPERALDGFLRALGIPGEHLPADLQERSRLYRSVLRTYAEQDRRILVVIDNAADAGQVRPLLPADDTSAVLLTSRNIPDVGARQIRLDNLTPQEAVGLLAQVLRQAHGPGDTRVKDEPAQAAQIAEQCGRLPLALQIAGALLADIPVRPLASFSQALSDARRRLDRLTREDLAVRAAFDLSYRHLGGEQARLFRLLSLNPGPDVCTDAAAALFGAGHDIVEEWLQDLARANLVESGPIWGRWRLHDLVRLYAAQLARDNDDGGAQREEAVDRLLTYYLTVTTDAQNALALESDDASAEAKPPATGTIRESVDVIPWLRVERANLMAAVALASDIERWQLVADLAELLAEHLSLDRHQDEAIAVRRQALIAARRLGNREEEGIVLGNIGFDLYGLRRYEEALETQRESLGIAVEVSNRESQNVALGNLGLIFDELGRPDEAIDVQTRALTIARELGDRDSETAVLNNLATTLASAGRLDEAVAPLMESRAICVERGDRRGEVRASKNIGVLASQMGDYELAITAHEYCVAVHDLEGDPFAKGRALLDLGGALHSADRLDEAIATFTEALAMLSEPHDERREQQQALGALAEALLVVGRPAVAVDACLRALALCREFDEREDEGPMLRILGKAYADADRMGDAADTYVQYLDVLIEQGADRASQGGALLQLGGALAESGRLAEGVDAFNRCQAIRRELGDREGERRALFLLGITCQQMARFEEAAEAHLRGVEICGELGDRAHERETLGELAGSLAEIGRFPEAIEAYTRHHQMCGEAGDRPGEAESLHLLGNVLARLDRFEEAVAAHTNALTVCRALGNWEGESYVLGDMGAALMGLGRYKQAAAAFSRAAAIEKERLRELQQGPDSRGRLPRVLRRSADWARRRAGRREG
ncbi:tetratricopeptide repeat protein [Streptomyces sp. NPDC087263]|uniref:tetratricopeptide repeat protein n=1 Tax=Streptomyces sp. NPDC087263 TaxID=3365773 RepID=UPI0038150387